jgi:hypothetical protein
MANALSIIPIHRDKTVNPEIVREFNGKSALEKTINYAQKISSFTEIDVSRICVTTNDDSIKKTCQRLENVFLPNRTEQKLEGALCEALKNCEAHFELEFDYIFMFEPLHPIRPTGLAKEALELLIKNVATDSVVCASELRGHIWIQDPDMQHFADDFSGSEGNKSDVFVESLGLLSVANRSVVLSGKRVGNNVGLVVVDWKWRFAEINDEKSFHLVSALEKLISTEEF